MNMKKNNYIYYPQLRFVLVSLLLLCLSQRATADDFTHNAANYMAYQTGVDAVKFTLPTGNLYRTNDGVQEGHVWVTVDDGSEQLLFDWSCSDYHNVDKGCKIKAFQDGRFQLQGKVKGGTKSFHNSNGEVSYVLDHDDNNTDHYTTTVVWTLPSDLRGRKLKFYVWAHINWAAAGDWHVPSASNHKLLLEWNTPENPASTVTLFEPMLSYDRVQINKVMLSYSVQAKSIKTLTLHYTNALTGKTHTQNITSKNLAGMVYLPADTPWRDVYLTAKIINTEGKEVDDLLQSNTVATKMLHHPRNLSVTATADGKAILTWKVDNPDEEDIDQNGLFEIQRNVSGTDDDSDGNWRTISMDIAMEQGQKSYTYTDATLLDEYTGQPVAYRIRRSAATTWSWANGDGHDNYQMPWRFMLPSIAQATAERSSVWNDDHHLVQFTFQQKKMADYDSKGRYIVRNDSDLVHLRQLVSEKKQIYQHAVFLLSSSDDWERLAEVVKSGADNLDVLMVSDIDLTDSKVMLGKGGGAFTGTFDGNGHTLTINYTSDDDSAAPFACLGSATIKNLRVNGNITSSGRYAAGIVGSVAAGNNSIELDNCWSTVTIESTHKGAAMNGGILGDGHTGKVVMNNCYFDGDLMGDSCHTNGGLIGDVAGANVTLNKCLFAPGEITTGTTDCQTFGYKSSQYGTLTLNNCYYTRPYGAFADGGTSYLVIWNTNNWDEFARLVAQDTPNVNAILTTDITVSDMVAGTFKGILDGNGHTLTLVIDGNSNSTTAAALFHELGGATVKNLTLQGSVKGGLHSAALTAFCTDNTTNYINNVRAKVDITTGATHAGGLIGHGQRANNKVSDCLFDGSITTTGNGQYAGAIIGWEQGGTVNAVTNCLERGTYKGFANTSMNFVVPGTAYGNTPENNHNNYSANGFGIAISAAGMGNEALQQALGNQWKVADGQVVPVTTVKDITDPQGGTCIARFTEQEMVKAFNDANWQVIDESPYLVYKSATHEAYDVMTWDPRARLMLALNMKGEGGTERKLVDITENDSVMKSHRFTYELPRKCVDYSFDLIIRRANSKLKIADTDADTLLAAAVASPKEDKFRFVDNDRIISFKATKKQSSVELVWQTSGGERDYFRLLRRQHSSNGNAQWTDTIATNLTQMVYEDKTVLVQQAYDYLVESVYQCEGTIVSQMTCSGECEPTGMVSGYVRMADGTAMGGVTVECRPDGTIPGASATYTTTTDETGYYEFSKLPFQGSGKYRITAVSSGVGGTYTAPNEGGIVAFSANSNWTQNFNFFMDTYFVYSGHVYYRDSSIPVAGVQFELDGNVMHDASQNPIETDTQGAFALSIPRGQHRVKAVKQGHRFADGGFLVNEDAASDKTLYNFTKNVTAIVWDSTTVVLRGRVVGGDVQGQMPLGRSQSKNNLGDSLKIVMQLEGDDASYLIRKQNDESVRSASYQVGFGIKNAKGAYSDTCQVDVTRHSLTIRPDKKTGEYELRLHPAKYKVTEVSAQGYATLFQQGKVGETLDLAFKSDGDTCEYSRIYHAMPDVEVTQFNPGGEKFFGIKQMKSADNLGNEATMNLFYWKKTSATDSTGVYAFGHPVFMAGSIYGWMLQACEKYYWNNHANGLVDIVKLNKGTVKIKNYLVGTDNSQMSTELELDENGGASYIFTPQNTTFTMENDMALKTVDITLLYDGTYYDIKPFGGQMLKGFVMATKPKANGRKSTVAGKPLLFDILRDPPGSGSSAYIEEGSTLSYGYSADINGTLGFGLTKTTTTGANIYHGLVTAPNGLGEEGGTINYPKTDTNFSFKVSTTFGFGWVYNYSLNVNERIQTQTGPYWRGSDADLFIGTTGSVILQDALAVRAIPDSVYQMLKLHEGGTFALKDGTKVKLPIGTTKVLATGTDNTGKPIYLVRDEVLQASPVVNSTFIHSQKYIEDELLPNLFKMRNALLLPKTTTQVAAKALANRQGFPAYISHVDADDDKFGIDYEVVYPDNGLTSDSIAALNQQALTWAGFLARNEEEKLSIQPSNLVKRYDFDGGASSIQYGESFSTSESLSRYIRYPMLNGFGDVITSGVGALASVFKNLDKLLTIKDQGVVTANPAYSYYDPDDGNLDRITVDVLGEKMTIKLQPIVSGAFNDKYSSTESHSKKVGFTLSTGKLSSMTVDVYRTATEYTISKNTNAFYNLTLDMLNNVRNGKLGYTELTYARPGTPVYSNFVYRTIGGLTGGPYEGERLTKWYQPGTVIDVATVPTNLPRIWIDEPVKSNVPFDEPARFVVHFTNETDYPNRTALSFNYKLQNSSNPNGATVIVDGRPLNNTGESLWMSPAVGSDGKRLVVTKEIQVYPSKAYDYENLTIRMEDPDDPFCLATATFSAHFIPSAGKVNISSPGNNWVVNTESPYDTKRKAWYMPVRIDGFDVNYPNFDHIELQYKLSTQGEKDWVNVCSYYADDDLRMKASGVTDTIPASGIITAAFYGEADPVEQRYDIRAVNYCRHAGGYLTRSSDILSGMKDTRRPEPFGTPEPANGILGIGDDLKIRFSEEIAGNYLRDINNFEVLGTPNSRDIATSTSVTFDGKNTFATTQARRNLAGKSFTVDLMLNPATDKREMTVMVHGGEEKGMRLGLTADRKLYAVINGQTATSDVAVAFNNMLHEVAYVIDQSGKDIHVSFFDGSKEIGHQMLIPGKYEGSSPIAIGTNYTEEETSYKGDMLEFRLWNRALTANDFNAYGQKALTGYESGLLDYYPMNEGRGDMAYDKAAGGMDLWLMSHTWKHPEGLSLKMDGKKGLLLDGKKLSRSKENDYTLMFWFRTTDKDATLLSNGEAKRGETDQISIGMKDATLYVRSAGYEKLLTKTNDGQWHHFAMTVSRPRNVANVYLDTKLTESFPADSLSGIVGDHIALGATYNNKVATANAMNGNIDEVGFFASVLPANLISEFSTHKPQDTFTPMIAYLEFSRSEQQDNNTQRLMPTGISTKRYTDSQGKMLARRDTLAVAAEVEALADRTVYAPMSSQSKLDKLNFDFVSRDNELLINIKEPDFMVEKSNIYVTVKEIPDMRGNLMKSPLTLNVYAYRNPLRWDVKKIDLEANYGYGKVFTAKVQNLSATSQFFELHDLPLWVTASQTSGTIEALGEQEIMFTVSDYTNIGTYNELISLVGSNTMSEPLPVTLKVRGEEPGWSVSDRLLKQNQTMMMIARVKIDGVVATSTEDIVGVFDENMQTMGVAHIQVDNTANANEALAYITVYGYSNSNGTKPTLSFRLFEAASGQVYSLKPDDGKTYTFEKDAVEGSAEAPVILENSFNYVQTLRLKKGWNWVAFNVVPDQGTTVGQFLNGSTLWEPGDMVTSVNGTTTQQWTCRENKTAARGYKWDKEDQPISIDIAQMYNIYAMSDKTVTVEGNYGYKAVTVGKNWNRIGYIPTINLPVAQALSDYAEQASAGDVIKSQSGFAVASVTANGIVWKGPLQYMEAGKGYMLKRMADGNATFEYPLYGSDSRYSTGNAASRLADTFTATTMNIVAGVSGVETEPGDKLVVYRGAERLTETEADEDRNFYLNIGSDDKSTETLTFTIERDGETVATTGSSIAYAANSVIGTPEQPTDIRFVSVDQMPADGRWYTTAGILLQKKPTRAGLYIYNGKVKIVK